MAKSERVSSLWLSCYFFVLNLQRRRPILQIEGHSQINLVPPRLILPYIGTTEAIRSVLAYVLGGTDVDRVLPEESESCDGNESSDEDKQWSRRLCLLALGHARLELHNCRPAMQLKGTSAIFVRISSCKIIS